MAFDTPGITYTSWRELLSPGEVAVQQKIGRDENAARLLLCYQNAIIPGLLQTPGYAREVMKEVHAFHGLTGDVDESADARIERQHIVTQPGHSFRFVIGEAALWSIMGSPEVMRAQLDVLAETAIDGVKGADLRLGIIPRTAPWRHNAHGFDIHISDTSAEASEETIAGSLTITDPQLVSEYQRVFTYAEELAAHGRDAANIINAVSQAIN